MQRKLVAKITFKKNYLKSAESGYADTFVRLVAWPSIESEAGGDHALRQTSLLFFFILMLFSLEFT